MCYTLSFKFKAHINSEDTISLVLLLNSRQAQLCVPKGKKIFARVRPEADWQLNSHLSRRPMKSYGIMAVFARNFRAGKLSLCSRS